MAARKIRRDPVNSIYSRMLLTYIAVMLVIIGVIGITVSAVLRRDIREQRREILQREADSLLPYVATTTVSVQTQMEEKARFIASYGRHLVKIIRPAGSSASYYADAKWEPVGNSDYSDSELKAIFTAAVDGTMDSLPIFAGSVGFPVLTAYRFTVDPDGSRAIVIVVDDAQDLIPAEQRIALIASIATMAGFLAAFVLVFATTNLLIKPFRLVNETVQRYAKGDYNARIPVSGIREAGQLAVSFNDMADQLRDLESTRQSFVANVSHELRSPLTSMRGFLEAMEDGTIPPEEHEKYIGVVLAETRRMAAMVNDLLDLARIESGQTALKLEVFDVNELIRRTLITFEARIYEKQADVEVRFAQDQFFVEADPNQIAQVLRNLIDNALKYSPDGKKLRIATYSMRREVYVSVQDFGYGIPEEDVPYVFERFYKVEKAHTPSGQSGTGLGLSIVKKIIDQHGQTITLSSAKGKGSTFTFTLRKANTENRQQ